MIVAIDGPAGSGKSTVARALAERCGLTYLDTGAMYRTIARECLRLGVDPEDAEAVAEVGRSTLVEFADNGKTVFANGVDVTGEIRTPEIDLAVSPVSANPAVRDAMTARQRELGGSGDVVLEGRDIGTVVFPNADVKVFLTADPDARAMRRAVQREGKDAAKDASATADPEAVAAILADLKRRDEYDSTREVAPLKPAEDAHHIDTSTLTVDQEIDAIVALSPRLAELRAAVDAASASEKKAAEEARQSAAASPEPKAEEKAEVRREPKVRAKKGGDKQVSGKMRAFAGNSYDDYHDHAMDEYPLPARLFMGLVIGVVGGVTKVLWPWEWENVDELFDEGGRMIIMNHVSMLDPICVVVSGYVRGISVRPIYKSEFDDIPVIGPWFTSRVGGIPVERGTADMKAVKRAKAALQRGEDVLIFPEGTRIKSDDEPAEIHGGFSLMAQLAKAPVQPTAIVGARDITPRGKKLKRLFTRVFLKASEPITFESLGVKGKKQMVAEMERVAMDKVYELRDALRAAHPGKM